MQIQKVTARMEKIEAKIKRSQDKRFLNLLFDKTSRDLDTLIRKLADIHNAEKKNGI